MVLKNDGNNPFKDGQQVPPADPLEQPQSPVNPFGQQPFEGRIEQSPKPSSMLVMGGRNGPDDQDNPFKKQPTERRRKPGRVRRLDG